MIEAGGNRIILTHISNVLCQFFSFSIGTWWRTWVVAEHYKQDMLRTGSRRKRKVVQLSTLPRQFFVPVILHHIVFYVDIQAHFVFLFLGSHNLYASTSVAPTKQNKSMNKFAGQNNEAKVTLL